MMIARTTDKILKTILDLITKAKKILVVVSHPIDPDCVGTSLTLRWWLSQQAKNVDAIRFFRIPQDMVHFPDIKEIKLVSPRLFDFSPYHGIMLIDGSDWSQFFGDDWEKIIQRIDIQKTVNLDHHLPGEIQAAIPERCLNVKTSSTAQLLYDYFIKPDNIKLTPKTAEYLYRSLIYDSRTFKNEIYPYEFLFAETLFSSGVDHDKVVDKNYDMREIEFMVWAIQHTEFIPHLQLTILVIDTPLRNQLNQRFGKDWMDFNNLYKEQIERQIKGYNYGIILIDNMDGTIKLGWRTRNYGNHLSIAEVAKKAGFQAGGHRNAGGGVFSGSIGSAKNRLLQKIHTELKKVKR